MLGRQLRDLFPIAFLPENHALAIAIMSYNGDIDYGLLGDYDALPDIDVIAEGIDASLQELLEAARGEAETGRRGRAARRGSPAGRNGRRRRSGQTPTARRRCRCAASPAACAVPPPTCAPSAPGLAPAASPAGRVCLAARPPRGMGSPGAGLLAVPGAVDGDGVEHVARAGTPVEA